MHNLKIHHTERPYMQNKPICDPEQDIADALVSGVNASIWYDADEHADFSMAERIRITQKAMLSAAGTIEAMRARIAELEKDRARVLIVVSGGMSDYASDGNVAVETFDRDNFESGRDPSKVSEEFRDLAEFMGVPVDGDDNDEQGLPSKIRG